MDRVEEKPDVTVAEIVAHLRDEQGISISESTVWRLLDRHGLTFKQTAHAAEQQRADVLCRRHAWFDLQPDLPAERETYFAAAGYTCEWSENALDPHE